MSDPLTPEAKAYLQRLRAELHRLPTEERDEILRDIAGHLTEARAHGQDVQAVIERLGPPRRLARSYEVEAMLDAGGGGVLGASFAAASVVFTTSLTSILAVPLMIIGAIALTLAGAFTIGAAILSLVVPAVHLRDVVVLGPLDPETPIGHALAVSLGGLAVAIGLLSVRALRAYLRFAAHALRRGLVELSEGSTRRSR